MQKPEIPADEVHRLAALHGLCILDTPVEERFDRITRVAKQLFNVPIALVSLVDSGRQWFKSHQGLDATETPRDVSFCAHAILSDRTFVITDTRLDPRFVDNPLVTGPPHVCFYAGHPLRSADGSRVGTLCILDQQPREFTAVQQALMADLAAWVERELNQKTLSDALQQVDSSKSELQTVLDTIADGIIATSGTGRIQTVNPAMERLFGYRPNELIGNDIKMLLPDSFAAEVDAYVAGVPEGGGVQAVGTAREVTGRRNDASVFPMELTISQARVGETRMITAVVRDISERKAAERMKNEFLSTVSHELRTPLTSIMGSLELVSNGVGGQLPPQADALIEIAQKNAVRLVRLINDILDIDKLESGLMHLEIRVHDLKTLIATAIDANRDYARQFGVNLVLQGAPPDVLVEVDGDRLLQVFANLLSNAAKFSPAGSDVTVAAERIDGRIRVAVADRGPGISPEFAARIFQRFSQADSSDTRQKGGSGLGLNITKVLVERMGGVITFASEPGAGTAFFVEFPIAAPATTPIGLATSSAAPDASRVLICEADRDVARLIQAMLNEQGYESAIAYDAAEAKRMLDDRPYAAITVDAGLPAQSGLDLIRELRAHAETSNVPVVVISAHAEVARNVLGGPINVVDWIDKPINERRLLAGVRSAVSIDHKRPRILHVEDDADIVEILNRLLAADFDVEGVATLAGARRALQQNRYSLVILDMMLPDGHGAELFPVIQRLNDPPPVMIFSVLGRSDELPDIIAESLVKSQTSTSKLLQTIQRLGRGGSPAAVSDGAD